ncbi:hypothetical protein FRX31_032612 [Thalictrum thalictroides]|uniref:U1-type domain-containing protein n=1 Tax=Thalictrum thalictroides TaxID=46969 RepID=A0A7J6UYV2_THATH|nr:hypothetical protein FRX31_032612 [Thalictrum thalictroides]
MNSELRRPELTMNSELRRPELMMNSDPLRESMQREWEKERIREQIIASEYMRRRELEAEVRRELAMERELAIRRGDGFSLCPPVLSSSLWSEPRWSESKLSILPFQARTESGPIERLPFQRDPEAAKMAAKPITANLAGIKRKVSDVIGANVPNASSSKKKAQDWRCALCQVSATCEYGLSMHLKGRKHKAKEAKLNEEAGKNTGNSSLGKKTNSRSSKKNKKFEVQAKKKLITPDMKRQFPFWCEDCQIGCHSEVVMDNHIKGKKHIARMKELKQTDGFASSTIKSHEAIHKKDDAFEEAIVDVKEDIDIEMNGKEVDAERPEVKANIVRELDEGQGLTTETMESLVDVVAEVDASKVVQQEAADIIESLAMEKEVETDGLEEVKENILREDGEEELEKKGQEEATES